MVGLYNDHHPWEETCFLNQVWMTFYKLQYYFGSLFSSKLDLMVPKKGVDANNTNTCAKAWHIETFASHVSIDCEGGYSWIAFVGSYSQHVDQSHDVIYVNLVGICIVRLTLCIPIVWPTIYTITHENCSMQWWLPLHVQPLTMFSFFYF
jgi:hypothetical protein